ncbi:MEMAR_RS02690 family S-layer glycoprotein [Methanofollis fontis]|uniref:PGF-CTERM sorting domain-containing protein n=1 Tax=Methanofollis fontis TaxID=2052832 RepID=A0A483CUJ8_9EURY|nr:MEMAR_RS02690 family S-layer glycoprotein [Methanofollis fontis]TAJ45286.1 PGF-CTERM sorting domain-containing protein [Methanofollis fontis]
MKSTSRMMVVAAVLLVAAAAFVMPAAARAVVNGDTIFDYESGLDLTAFAANGNQLAKYTDDDPAKGQIFSIPIANAASLDLTAIDLQGNYGTYFLVQNTLNKVYIRDPTVVFGAVLENDITSSIAGKTVTKNTPIAFQFDATEVGTYLTTATVKVELKTPGGGVLTEIPDRLGVLQSFTNHALNAPRTYIRNIDISQLEAGTYSAQAKWQTPGGFSDYATNSNSVSFTVASKEIAIESNKENVVRNNPFVVTVTGDSKTNYYLYIKDASVAAAQYPTIKPGQPSVTITNVAFAGAVDPAADTLANGERATVAGVYVASTAAVVATDAGGKRSIEFATTSQTDDKTFTIKVVDPSDASKYDEVKVKIEEGEVTITAEGAGSYYLGEEVKLSGTNTDSDNVYLFMTGPNLGDGNGVQLNDVTKPASGGNYVQRAVESDDTWEYRWDTAALANTGSVLDAGTYTVYAASNNVDSNGVNVDKSHLSGVKYQTFSVVLKSPYLSLDDIGAVVAKGDKLKLTGVAEGKPDQVQIWIFGKNYRLLGATASVEDDGTFEYTLERADTQNLATGQYYVVVQHPMTDGVFNVFAVAPGSTTVFTISNDWSLTVVDLGGLSASEGATALVDMINSPNCDDTYRKVSFNLEEAWIRIDSIGDKAVGDKFTISGTTNLAVGDDLTVDVTSASFQPTSKDEATSFSGASGTVTVAEGTDYNTWSFDVDASNFKADQYSVTVESVDADVTQSATFNVLEAPATTTAPVTTAPVTTAPVTTAPVTTAATTPVTQPGFGALISLIGLGAVAVLVMRRN